MALAPSRTTISHAKSSTTHPTSLAIQIRHATFIPRPRRPYTFTQLVTLSDGSTYTMRTTSPNPIYRASKDTRNTLLWQPSEKSLRNVELDEAGKLAAFRERFGRAFDATAQSDEGEAPTAASEATDDVFADLITGYAPQDTSAMKDSGPKKAPTRRK
ncbi:putative 50S ribosomal protein L36 [Metarhizium anisopliae]|uniref:Ribosomal protein bL31m N-terminal domain-containing protein n=2 Tax=Metarhizium TaxID=5529 RepID=A0A0D9PE90_METAN